MKKITLYFLIFLILTYIMYFFKWGKSSFFLLIYHFYFLTFLRINFKLFLTSSIIFIITFLIFYLSIENRILGITFIERYTKILNSMQIKNVFKKKKYFRNSTKFFRNYKRNYRYKKIIIFTAGHETLYRTAFNMFLDKPIIGHGPRMFRIKCSDPKYSIKVNDVKSSCMTYPHNFYIQLLAETGIVGFSFIFSICLCDLSFNKVSIIVL